MRSRFDQQLALLNQEMTRMGAMCEEAISLTARALAKGDEAVASEAAAFDEEIDAQERKIEALCLKLLLQQQPVARDLRQISAALKMITDLERIGDQAADIAEIIPFLKGRTTGDWEFIPKMAEAAAKMVSQSLDAYVCQDISLAEEAIAWDDVVDGYFDKVKEALIALLAKSPEEGEYALDLLMIAKYFERIGDHATNIAEWVVFSVTGVHKGEKA